MILKISAHRKINMKFYQFTFYFFGLLMSGCNVTSGMHFPVSQEFQIGSKADDQVNIIRVNVNNIKNISKETSSVPPIRKSILPIDEKYVYKIGRGDMLKINLWQSRDGASNDTAVSILVTGEGKIYYPFVGEVQVSDLTTSEIRKLLTKKLSSFIKKPQIDVSVEQFNSHRATLIGAVRSPGQISITNVPLTLLDSLNIQGLGEDADLSAVILRRDKKEYKVNINNFLLNGNRMENPQIFPNDIIIVNELKKKQIYTFGEIGVGEILFTQDDPSLTSMLAQKNIIKNRADIRGVFVFRQTYEDASIDVYQFDFNKPEMLVMAQAFEMRGNDVLFVTTDPITRWNDTLSKILSPVISTIKAQAVVEAVN